MPISYVKAAPTAASATTFAPITVNGADESPARRRPSASFSLINDGMANRARSQPMPKPMARPANPRVTAADTDGLGSSGARGSAAR